MALAVAFAHFLCPTRCDFLAAELGFACVRGSRQGRIERVHAALQGRPVMVVRGLRLVQRKYAIAQWALNGVGVNKAVLPTSSK